MVSSAHHQKPVPTGQTVRQYSRPAVGASDRHLNRAVDRPVEWAFWSVV